jgi:DNA-binding MarR family transcriptional regulator
VFITDSGRQLLDRAAKVQEEIENEVLQALDADERATLKQLLSRALRGAETTTPCAADPGLASTPL